MWNYVSRRIKDTLEKTANIFDVGRTHFQFECPLSARRKALENCRKSKCSIAKFRKSSTAVGNDFKQSDSGQDEYKEQIPHEKLNQSWIGAITASSAIICGWYTSQLLCLHRRRQLPWEHSKYSFHPVIHALAPQQHRQFHTGVFNRVALAAPPKEYASIGDKIGDFPLDPAKFVHNVSNDKVVDEPKNTSEKLSLRDAAQNLKTLLGDTHFNFGVHSLNESNFEEATYHFRLATLHRHPSAAFNLALCYERGMGVKKDLRMAMEFYQMATEMGHAKAMYNLGVFYVHGLGGLKRNRRVARELFEVAAKLGQEDAQAALRLTKPQESTFDPTSLSHVNNMAPIEAS
ncbi:hypothetical protein DMENIID0001_128750 [Sergentomyia squamirostris]